MPQQDQQSTKQPQAADENEDTSRSLPHAQPGGQTNSATGEKPGGGGGAPQSKTK